MNPIRAKIVKKPEEFKWSSYKSYIGSHKSSKWLSIKKILGYFNQKNSTEKKFYRKYVNQKIIDREIPALKDLKVKTCIEDIINEVNKTLEEDSRVLVTYKFT